jgi:hypothetical protein
MSGAVPRGVTEVLFQRFPGRTEENHENSTVCVSVEIRTGDFLNIIQKLYHPAWRPFADQHGSRDLLRLRSSGL